MIILLKNWPKFRGNATIPGKAYFVLYIPFTFHHQYRTPDFSNIVISPQLLIFNQDPSYQKGIFRAFLRQ